jgi:hypothetical protein
MSQPPFYVHCSGAIAAELRDLQRKTASKSRRREIAEAFAQIVEKLQTDAPSVGEPQYHLPRLNMQVRTCSLRPLVVDFGVHEDLPIVQIKSVKLLS